MPRYRVLAKSFINNALVEEGAEIDFDGEAGPNLQPLDKPKGKSGKPAIDATTDPTGGDAGTGAAGSTEPDPLA